MEQVRPPFLEPTPFGEGTVAAARGGDIVGIGWMLSYGDLMVRSVRRCPRSVVLHGGEVALTVLRSVRSGSAPGSLYERRITGSLRRCCPAGV